MLAQKRSHVEIFHDGRGRRRCRTGLQHSWAEIAGVVEIPDCALATVELYAEGPGEGIDLYVDHVSMRPLIVDEGRRSDELPAGASQTYDVSYWVTTAVYVDDVAITK